METLPTQDTALLAWMHQMAPYGLLTTDAELRIRSWNQWLEHHSGLAAADVIGQPLFELFPDLAARGLDSHFQRALAGEVSVLATGLHRYLLPLSPTTREGGYSHMQQSARIAPLSLGGRAVAGTIVVIEDVTLREYQAATLRRQQEHDRLLSWALARLLQAADPWHEIGEIFAAVALSLRFEVYFNHLYEPGLRRLHLHVAGGLPPAQRQQLATIALGESSVGRCAQTRTPVLINHLASHTSEPVATLRDLGMTACAAYPLLIGERLMGTLCFATSTREELSPADLEILPRLAQYVAIALDRSQRETALLEAQKSLREHAGLLETRIVERTAKLHETIVQLESFSYTVAHDLRAPIRSLRGFCDILLEEYGELLPEEARFLLQRMLNAGVRLDALTRDLLQFSKVSRQDIALEPVSVDEVVHELVQVTPALQGDVVTIVGPLGTVLGQRTMLQQCLSNLLDNALKFVAPGVIPRIRVRGERGGPLASSPAGHNAPFNPAAHPPGESDAAERDEAEDQLRLRIWVEDNGIGIPQIAHEKIFGIFERVSGIDSIEGTGIGLAIVARAVQRMGGTYGVESTPGEGSRFWLELRGANVLLPEANVATGVAAT
jgi:PAS domain S-box-containing protein